METKGVVDVFGGGGGGGSWCRGWPRSIKPSKCKWRRFVQTLGDFEDAVKAFQSTYHHL